MVSQSPQKIIPGDVTDIFANDSLHGVCFPTVKHVIPTVEHWFIPIDSLIIGVA